MFVIRCWIPTLPRCMTQPSCLCKLHDSAPTTVCFRKRVRSNSISVGWGCKQRHRIDPCLANFPLNTSYWLFPERQSWLFYFGFWSKRGRLPSWRTLGPTSYSWWIWWLQWVPPRNTAGRFCEEWSSFGCEDKFCKIMGSTLWGGIKLHRCAFALLSWWSNAWFPWGKYSLLCLFHPLLSSISLTSISYLQYPQNNT